MSRDPWNTVLAPADRRMRGAGNDDEYGVRKLGEETPIELERRCAVDVAGEDQRGET
jgi:hypothetical protein